MELAINGKTYNLRIIRKTNTGISLYFIAQEDNQTDIKRIRITKDSELYNFFQNYRFREINQNHKHKPTLPIQNYLSINLFVLLAKRKYNASHYSTSMTLLECYHPRNPFIFFNDKTIDRKVSQKLAAKNKKDQPNSLNCKLCDTAKLEKRTNCSFHKNTSKTN